jgi:transcriptional regulator with XRE-family HTH domain
MSRRRIEDALEGRDPRVLAHNVRRAREGLGWTRQRLCAEAGVSPQTLARIEGGRGCTPGVERKVAGALGTVVGRLWEELRLQRESVRIPAGDRWYFAGHADGERYWKSQSFEDPEEPMRYDPDAIQDAAERARMGLGGLAVGFVRVTTGHLSAGTVISSVIELYGRIESGLPEGRLAYFHVVRGAIRFGMRDRVHELAAGGVLQAEMSPSAWLEPTHPVAAGAPPPLVIFVDLAPRLTPPRAR